MEWKETCALALRLLLILLPLAHSSPELVQFMTNNDIDPAVRKNFSVDDIWPVDMHILAFLSVSPFLELSVIQVYNPTHSAQVSASTGG